MPESMTEEDARYALDLVKTICARVGPGQPGSGQERERADIIETTLASHLGVGNVVIEEFTAATGAFLGSLLLSGIFVLLAVLLNLSVGRITRLPPWTSAA